MEPERAVAASPPMLHATLSLLGGAIALAVAYLWAGTIMIWVLMLVAMVLIVDGLTLLWTRGGGWHDHRQ